MWAKYCVNFNYSTHHEAFMSFGFLLDLRFTPVPCAKPGYSSRRIVFLCFDSVSCRPWISESHPHQFNRRTFPKLFLEKLTNQVETCHKKQYAFSREIRFREPFGLIRRCEINNCNFISIYIYIHSYK